MKVAAAVGNAARVKSATWQSISFGAVRRYVGGELRHLTTATWVQHQKFHVLEPQQVLELQVPRITSSHKLWWIETLQLCEFAASSVPHMNIHLNWPTTRAVILFTLTVNSEESKVRRMKVLVSSVQCHNTWQHSQTDISHSKIDSMILLSLTSTPISSAQLVAAAAYGISDDIW